LSEPLAHLIIETLEKEFKPPWLKLKNFKATNLATGRSSGRYFRKGRRP
jgi:hypothetical protein